MAEAAKNPTGGQGSTGQPAPAATGNVPSPQASLSQKAEELTARLEQHKNQAQADAVAQREKARKEAIRRAMSGKTEADAKNPAPAPADKTQPAPVKPAAAKAPSAKPAAAPAAKPAAAKPAAAKPAAAKPAAAKPVAKAPAAAKSAAAKSAAAKPATKEPVEDVIRAIKLPHEIEAEKRAQSEAKATAGKTAEPQADEKSSTAQSVPPVSAAPKTGSLPTTKAAVAQARNRVFGSYDPEPEPSEAAMKRRVARERALNSKPALGRTAQVIVALVFPLLTLIAAIRLVATPAFLALSYGRPGFPSDSFGFTDAERLTYGSYGVDYLNNFAGPEYLSGLKLSTGSSMFTEGEVQHMVDVKNLIGFAYILGAVLAVILIIGIWYLAKRYAGGVRRALFSGAILALAGIAALAVSAIMGWDNFFTQFHALFFSDGTWTFNVSDTLIRLYPEQFWLDSAIAIAVLVLATIIAVIISCWPTGRRREAARLRQEARAFGIGN
ncbi:TIGR01906 family membrane protein [Glutamicibacter nicotianae]|uniref:TIGR01906 family membrane protein n=1 Tax=Glutamicibacter nicotianae TaxID=37929 RepID=UPI00195A9666|nr:TIGR01906 family membrane protein [Glutamicibacter nicotianae]MBM7767624.1 integral membrane protein (TIGR01906 family) [Glutamicibacter nicotianae]